MQKARRHWISQLRPLVSVWFQVLFHPPIRSTFHLSFTVLVHYRSLRSIQPYQMVLATSNGASPTPPYSGYYLSITSYAYGAITRYGLVSHPVQLHVTSIMQSYNPSLAVTNEVWALTRSLATTCAITRLFSSPPGTQMFQFPGFASSPCGGIMYLQYIGLPHSDIYGSIAICASPQLFAAYHVLLRL